jgi:predicted HD phosphohydrolase
MSAPTSPSGSIRADSSVGTSYDDGMTDLARTSFTAFDETTAEDWAIITEGIKVTQSHVADNVIAQLQMLRHDHGGFPVDRLEHSLQTATRAQRDGRDDEYVLCALIHDIGDNLAPYNHPAIAAGIVKPFVSEANHWLVEHHGIFQGYYFWHHIGLDRNAREAFRDSPYFEYTEEFCAKYDQVAFDADYRSEPLEHFEPLIRATFG